MIPFIEIQAKHRAGHEFAVYEVNGSTRSIHVASTDNEQWPVTFLIPTEILQEFVNRGVLEQPDKPKADGGIIPKPSRLIGGPEGREIHIHINVMGAQ